MEPIRSVYQDDPDMLEIVREFAEELPSRVKEIERCLESGAHSELQTLAHQLKGAGGGYGFAPITESAAALEQALKAGQEGAQLKDLTRALCDVLRAVEVPEEA